MKYHQIYQKRYDKKVRKTFFYLALKTPFSMALPIPISTSLVSCIYVFFLRWVCKQDVLHLQIAMLKLFYDSFEQIGKKELTKLQEYKNSFSKRSLTLYIWCIITALPMYFDPKFQSCDKIGNFLQYYRTKIK